MSSVPVHPHGAPGLALWAGSQWCGYREGPEAFNRTSSPRSADPPGLLPRGRVPVVAEYTPSFQ